nr:hypothetical protein [Tanacetum cinerariifolium]
MEHSNPTLAKILILDIGIFEQWKFRIQQYLQHEHYALWEVIEFGDSYEAPQNDAATGSAKHQLRLSKYKTAQELWDAILKTFGGNEATKKAVWQLQSRSLAPEWLMHTIVWRNRSDLDAMSLDDLYNHLKVYEPEVQKKSESNFQNMAFISLAKNNSGKEEVNTASISTVSTQVSPTSANVASASISLDTICAYIASQSNESQIKYEDINKIDEDDIEEMDIKAPRSQERGRRENYIQGSKEEEQAPKALMAIDGVGWDWSFMENEEEYHALVADEEAPTEFALMAKSSSDNEVFDNSLCSKACKKNTDSLNSKITDLSDKLSDTKTMLYHYKLDSKLTGFQSAFKDLDNLLESQRSDKNKEGLGYSVVPPLPAQVYSPPKKDINPSVTETGASSSTILSKPAIKFVKAGERPTELKQISKWVDQGKKWAKNNYTHKSRSPRTVFHKTDRFPTGTTRPNINAAHPKRTSFYKPAHSYVSRPLQRKSAVRTQARVPRVPTVNRKFPIVNKKFSTGNSKVSTVDLGKKGKAVKASAC